MISHVEVVLSLNLKMTRKYINSIKDYTFSGDVDGDGYDDLIVHYTNSNGKRCLRVYSGNNINVFWNDYNTTTTNSHNELIYPCSIYSCDVNCDGRCDIIVKWKDGNNARFYVYKGKINSTFTSAQSTSTSSKFYN